jgi:predicted ribosome quality control (RQC) complex YloA/Tae2 family protein
MKIILDVRKTAQENAQSFFDEAKRLRSKMKGAVSGMREVENKLAALEKKTLSTEKKAPEKRRTKEWFEKFRWCFTRNGLLVVGGRDAHSNEALVKRHMEDNDWYFHADVHGAPHCILKCDKTKPTKEDFDDAASFAGLFSSVWKKGLLSVRVYAVKPSQVSKKAPTGESLGRGAFIISGERKWFDPSFKMGWGIQELKEGFRAMCGPLSCVKAYAIHLAELSPGEKSKTDVAKSYQKWLEKQTPSISIPLDELVASLPPGEFSSRPLLAKK